MTADVPNPSPGSILGGIPAGWKLVPIEPTEEMKASVDCAGEKWSWLSGQAWASGWKSMVGAAPQADLSWQPIETAPKDGTKIDLWVNWSEVGEWYRSPDAYWTGSDWMLSSGFTILQYKYTLSATHWMPAPTGPLGDVPAQASGSDL